MKRRWVRGLWRAVGVYLPLAAFLFFALFPFYWMLIVSFKHTNDLFEMRFNPFWIQQFTVENYLYLFQNTDFSSWLQNTIIVTVSATSISLVCSVLIGYALARLRFPGSNFLGVGIFLAYLVPPTLLFLPLAQVIAALRLLFAASTIRSALIVAPADPKLTSVSVGPAPVLIWKFEAVSCRNDPRLIVSWSAWKTNRKLPQTSSRRSFQSMKPFSSSPTRMGMMGVWEGPVL